AVHRDRPCERQHPQGRRTRARGRPGGVAQPVPGPDRTPAPVSRNVAPTYAVGLRFAVAFAALVVALVALVAAVAAGISVAVVPAAVPMALPGLAVAPAGARRPGARPVHVDRAVDDDRPAPAAIGVHLPALERMEGVGTGPDAQPLGHGAPALAGMTIVFVDHVDAGDAEGMCDRARVVHVGRCPVASIEQVDQQRTRRAVVPVHFVDEGIAVIPAVLVDLAKARIDPDVAGADVVADGLRRGG